VLTVAADAGDAVTTGTTPPAIAVIAASSPATQRRRHRGGPVTSRAGNGGTADGPVLIERMLVSSAC
jgi:hypothetical protein